MLVGEPLRHVATQRGRGLAWAAPARHLRAPAPGAPSTSSPPLRPHKLGNHLEAAMVTQLVAFYELDHIGARRLNDSVGPDVRKKSVINKPLMTKRDLVIRISNETGLVQQQVLDVIQKTLDYISQSVAQGRKVELRNFGVFEVKVRKARVGRNPNAPETDVPIPERAVVKFKPGKEMREKVIKLTSAQVAAAAAEEDRSDKDKGDED